MVYRVVLEKHAAFEAAIEVDAEDAEKALAVAEQRASDGLVAWTQVNGHVEAWEAFPCK